MVNVMLVSLYRRNVILFRHSDTQTQKKLQILQPLGNHFDHIKYICMYGSTDEGRMTETF